MAPFPRPSDGTASSATLHGALILNPDVVDRFLDTFAPSIASGDEPPLKKLRISPPDWNQNEELIPINSLKIDLVNILLIHKLALLEAEI
jgi:hypothetical protein